MRIGILGQRASHRRRSSNRLKENDEVVVAAVAARDVSRAQAFAAKHGIARVHDSYEALIADPDLDAIYNPLPNRLARQVDSGGAGRGQARAVRKAVHRQCRRGPRGRRTGRQVRPGRDGGIPLPLPPAALCASRKSSPRASWASWSGWRQRWCFWMPKFSDIRYNYSLAGGALMDARMLCGRHGAHVRRFDPGSRFGAGEAARPCRWTGP